MIGNQVAYLWHDAELNAVKIGKTDNWRRFCPERMWSALSLNPHIKFIAAWQTDMPACRKKGGIEYDAGEKAGNDFPRAAFGTAAREWYRVTPDTAMKRMTDLWGSPVLTELPEQVVNRRNGPYDATGNVPKAGGLSRLWIYRERREGGLLKVSDNSWWYANHHASWKDTFAPYGRELLAGYEWTDAMSRPREWQVLNQELRRFKNKLGEKFAPASLPAVARCGWLTCGLEEVLKHIAAVGLVKFDIHGPKLPGVKGMS